MCLASGAIDTEFRIYHYTHLTRAFTIQEIQHHQHQDLREQIFTHNNLLYILSQKPQQKSKLLSPNQLDIAPISEDNDFIILI